MSSKIDLTGSPGTPKKSNSLSVIMFILIGTLVVVMILMAVLKTNDSSNHNKIQGMTSSNNSTDENTISQVNTFIGNRQTILNDKPAVQGGKICFKPSGGKFIQRVQVELSIEEPLKSIRGNLIDSDIYYTLDGEDPIKQVGRKYIPGKPILLKGVRTAKIKARLISRVGIYEGRICSNLYTIIPAVVHKENITTIPQLSSQESTSASQAKENTIEIKQPDKITDFKLLDRQSQEGIIEKMKSFSIPRAGVTEIIEGSDQKILIAISEEGKGRMIKISGFTVEPEEEMDSFGSRLKIKIQGIPFPLPTVNETRVAVEAWLNFTKIKVYENYILFQR